jgi:hypothetical protein
MTSKEILEKMQEWDQTENGKRPQWDHLRIWSDVWEDEGREGIAQTLRWMANNLCFPVPAVIDDSDGKIGWSWFNARVFANNEEDRSSLPEEVFTHLKGTAGDGFTENWRDHYTLLEAIESLSHALEKTNV